MKVSVIIPAYNAGDTLGDLLAEAVEWVDLCDVMVVNDGSDDATAAIIERSPVISLAHVANCGKGRALRTGFAHALSLGYDAVITLDADGQHDPRYIPELIDLSREGHYDIVVGSRRNNFAGMSFARYLSNSITTVVVSLLAGQKIEDSQCGYRLIRREVLEAIVLETDGYQMESELLIKAGRRGFTIGQVPIDIRSSATSHIRHLSDTWKFVVMAIKLL
jgi:glycosyltransferase involved in cell wall biosynthesis